MFTGSDTIVFKQFADSIPQLVWSSDPSGNPVYANARCIEYTGYDITEKQNGGWTKAIHPEDLQQTYQAWSQAIATGQIFQAEYRLCNTEGVFRWFLGRAVPIRAVGGSEIQHWFGTGTDIEEQKQIESELICAKEAAEAANLAKTFFLANMSHEIRTPLGAVLGFADLMTDSSISESERHECIQTIRRNGEQLSQLIDAVLDLSKIESDNLELELRDFSPQALFEDVAGAMRLRASEKGIALSVSFEENVPLVIQSDALRLRQIILNIVGNAIKFTTAGKIDVSVSSKPIREGHSEISIRVRDTGMGLTAEQRAKLFRPFSQADSSTNRRYGGTGLGLVLSQKLAKALGGDIVICESSPGFGSTFLIHFQAATTVAAPLRNVPTEPMNAASLPARRTLELEGKKILVVDDSLDNRVLLTWLLKNSGAEVDTAEDGKQSVELAIASSQKKTKYDAILMDIQMPVMDGFEAYRQLRANSYLGPVIALTAFAMKEERQRCLDAGFDAHVTKPVNRAELLRTILHFCARAAQVENPGASVS